MDETRTKTGKTVSLENEDLRLQAVTSENAASIAVARQRAEADLLRAREELERRNAELTRLVTMLRATLESASDGILVTTNDGTITDFNEHFTTMWQIPREVMETGDYGRVLDYSAKSLRDARSVVDRTKEIYANMAPDSFDVLQLADGRTLERFSKMQIVRGVAVGRVWTFRDISHRIVAEQEHAYLSSIVTSSADAIVSKTLSGVITTWNAAAQVLFGYSPEEAIGQPMTIIIPTDRMHEERSILERLGRGERIDRFETMRVNKHGRLVKVSITISPIKDARGRVIGASNIARDMTEREELLWRAQLARAEAEEANRLKDEFLATLSHELRGPLNAILGWAQLLRSGKLDEQKTREAIDIVERNARSEAQLIEDLLDVSRIITGKLRLEMQPIMPAQSIEAALDSVALMAEAKGVELRARLDPNAGPITGDAGRLQQVVWNLLSNAIKFTRKGGQVEVRLKRVDSDLEIAVSDTGEGIDAEFLPYVFDRFRQADSALSRRTVGLGLGLAIVRHLVEQHGGSITASSPGKGKGATFIIHLPLRPSVSIGDDEIRPEAHPRRAAAFGDAPGLTGVRVLVVDDVYDTRILLKEILERYGATVKEVAGPAEAFELLQQWRPAVIVSDIGMPEEDGYAFIRRVREWEQQVGTRVPAIALTAFVRSADRVEALVAGYQAHIAKPIDPLEFARMVARVVQAPPALTGDPAGSPAPIFSPE